MKVFCISGKAGHGKDTFANILSNKLMEKDQRVLTIHYADLLKWMCQKLFDWDGVKDDEGRHLLQYVGTNVIRKQNPDFWVGFVADVLGFFGDEWDYVLIPDCRFPNEIEFLRSRGFDVTHIRIVRSGFKSALSAEQKAHPSETALDDYPVDVVIRNNGTLDELYDSVVVHTKGDDSDGISDSKKRWPRAAVL